MPWAALVGPEWSICIVTNYKQIMSLIENKSVQTTQQPNIPEVSILVANRPPVAHGHPPGSREIEGPTSKVFLWTGGARGQWAQVMGCPCLNAAKSQGAYLGQWDPQASGGDRWRSV